MTALVFLLLLGGAVYVVLWLVLEACWREERVRAELKKADRRVDVEHRNARRAMNDAAGQSWRNLAD